MRLESIKLVGFKSFVDATTVRFPSNLVGIVGPNGCGKSNIIDAVRWVMGESSAKYLRGESMSDVIFNGASGRKPVEKASVELLFDNSDGGLGGAYAGYNQISIRREVTRDAQSNYYLNDARCRRRDITDIFLGTGLGPRSYAVIQQGTIARIIEAKPDELRQYLEEAAGISKYKERRKETQNRIARTRENLERLTDLREELAKQLSHLERQAKAAERYKVLKKEQGLLTVQQHALTWRQLANELEQQEALMRKEEVESTRLETSLRSLDTQIEKLRQERRESSEAFNSVQSRYYSGGTDIARLEQRIQSQKERQEQLKADLLQAENTWRETEHLFESDQNSLLELKKTQEEITPQTQQAKEHAEKEELILNNAERVMNTWQENWDEFNQAAAENTKTAQVEQIRIQHLEQQLRNVTDRIRRLETELTQLDSADLAGEIETLSISLQEATSENDTKKLALESIRQKITGQREKNTSESLKLNQARGDLQRLQGRQASLETLQQAALGKTNSGATAQWLQSQELSKNTRLAESLEVLDGWDLAAETVLGDYLQAVCVDTPLEELLPTLTSLTDGHIQLISGLASKSEEKNSKSAGSLGSKIISKWSVDELVSGVYVADDLATANALRSKLASHESVITRDGIWLGKSWVRVARDKDQKQGVIKRKQDMAVLSKEISIQIEIIEFAESTLKEGEKQFADFEKERDVLQHDLSSTAAQLADTNTHLKVKQQRVEHIGNRLQELNKDVQELKQQEKNNGTDLSSARIIWQEAMRKMEQDSLSRESLQSERDIHRAALEQARGKARHSKEVVHQLAIKIESTNARILALTQSIEREEKQIIQLSERRETLKESLNSSMDPSAVLQKELDAGLTAHSEVEAELNKARQQVDAQEEALNSTEKQRHDAEQGYATSRNKLEQKRMASQESSIKQKALEEQISETSYELTVLLEELPESAEVEIWQQDLERVTLRIQRLGAINLAAIDECSSYAERKEYLEAQNKDLEEALSILEEAIQKIDKETRTRFKETYDSVQENFQTLFPKLFGGGSATLELTENDLLEGGVTVMARPPGKRNSTIHLLSGGEKALTALALVFAIFQLNPAPFCMLDEVDAPLDDANVARFCNLVSEMSKKLQFIYISHNKPSMEMAEQLIGITMNEPGVSRTVAVDMNVAMEMAEA